MVCETLHKTTLATPAPKTSLFMGHVRIHVYCQAKLPYVQNQYPKSATVLRALPMKFWVIGLPSGLYKP